MKLITLLVIVALGAAAQTPEDVVPVSASGRQIENSTTVTATALSVNEYQLSPGGFSASDVAPSVAPVATPPPSKRTAAARATRRQHVITAILSVAIAIAFVFGTSAQ